MLPRFPSKPDTSHTLKKVDLHVRTRTHAHTHAQCGTRTMRACTATRRKHDINTPNCRVIGRDFHHVREPDPTSNTQACWTQHGHTKVRVSIIQQRPWKPADIPDTVQTGNYLWRSRGARGAWLPIQTTSGSSGSGSQGAPRHVARRNIHLYTARPLESLPPGAWLQFLIFSVRTIKTVFEGEHFSFQALEPAPSVVSLEATSDCSCRPLTGSPLHFLNTCTASIRPLWPPILPLDTTFPGNVSVWSPQRLRT